MAHKALWIALLAVLVLGLCAGCVAPVTSPQASTTAEPLAEVPRAQVASATGVVVPARWAALAFPLSGPVETLAVAVGDEVQPGQVLASLEKAALRAQVAQAEAALAAAEARLGQLAAGPRPEDLAAADAAVAAAQADVARAEAAVEAARAQQAAAQAAVAAAEAALAQAQAAVRQLEERPFPEEVAAAEAEMKGAEARVRQAQAAYDRVKDQPYAGMLPEALALEQATLAYQAAKARYEALLRGATQAERDAAKAGVAAAQASLEGAKAQLALAQAQVAQAEAAREGAKALLAQAEARRALLAAGPTETQRAEAQAAVDQARAALQAAQATLAQAELRSPIQGTVTAVAIRRGEFAVAGTPVVTVGDLSHLQVETTDLNEVDVARVRVGQEVTLTFDALPAKSLRGRVVRIAPMASGQGGGVNYTVTIELEEQDPALRWGMTAFVDILVEQK